MSVSGSVNIAAMIKAAIKSVDIRVRGVLRIISRSVFKRPRLDSNQQPPI